MERSEKLIFDIKKQKNYENFYKKRLLGYLHPGILSEPRTSKYRFEQTKSKLLESAKKDIELQREFSKEVEEFKEFIRHHDAPIKWRDALLEGDTAACLWATLLREPHQVELPAFIDVS